MKRNCLGHGLFRVSPQEGPIARLCLEWTQLPAADGASPQASRAALGIRQGIQNACIFFQIRLEIQVRTARQMFAEDRPRFDNCKPFGGSLPLFGFSLKYITCSSKQFASEVVHEKRLEFVQRFGYVASLVNCLRSMPWSLLASQQGRARVSWRLCSHS